MDKDLTLEQKLFLFKYLVDTRDSTTVLRWDSVEKKVVFQVPATAALTAFSAV